MSEFNLSYAIENGEQQIMAINDGQMLFLVGANGTGKSTLMQHFSTQNAGKFKRITAHRQVWFQNDSIELTAASRRNTEQQMRQQDSNERSRYRDDFAAQRSQAVLFDLVDAENVAARQIAEALRGGNEDHAKELCNNLPPIEEMNSILRQANLSIAIGVAEGDTLTAKREGVEPYSIAQLSDGERNALLIIATVLTCPEDTLILIDEPERHLHRSIVSPLLTTLLNHRTDCAFVISTHDVALPLEQSECSALLIRGYVHQPRSWEADLVADVQALDDELAEAILGSRRSILFVEGTASSLDLQLYQILFPDVSIKPVGSCVDVERIVRGLRAAPGDHRAEAFGIIDRDNRSEENCAALNILGVYPLEHYSVEAVYYHPTTMRRVAERLAQVKDMNPEAVLAEAVQATVNSASAHRGRLCARLVERKVQDELVAKAPQWNAIEGGTVEIHYDTGAAYNQELERFDALVQNNDAGGLISRYPLRETPALDLIATSLGLQSRLDYEGTVRKLISEDTDARQSILELIEPISGALSPGE